MQRVLTISLTRERDWHTKANGCVARNWPSGPRRWHERSLVDSHWPLSEYNHNTRHSHCHENLKSYADEIHTVRWVTWMMWGVKCEVAAADLRYYIILAWKTGIVRKLKSGATGRESNVGSLEYDSGVITTWPWWSVRSEYKTEDSFLSWIFWKMY
jgi:hypothetical protein